GIFTDQALQELPADYWRWWLIANAPETSDTDFNTDRFVADVNKDLADIFGNLVNRIVSFTHRAFDGRIPCGGEPSTQETALAAELEQRIASLRTCHEACEFRRAAAETRAIWSAANAYLQHAAPWTAIKSDSDRAAVVARIGLNLVRLSAVLAWSIIPALCEPVLRAFGEDEVIPRWPCGPIGPFLNGSTGAPVLRLDPLVAKITREKADHLAARFGEQDGA
ncbi:MAG: class I tRNA ligase family protein, partial [Bradyrhizobium sp.]